MGEYLRLLNCFPKSTSKQLLLVFQKMKSIGFTRIDSRLRHFIVTEKGVIKVVDHVNSFKKKQAWPISCFRSLDKLKLLDPFLEHVKNLDSEQYLEWKKFI